MRIRSVVLAAVLGLLSTWLHAQYRIGVHYFPGWKDNQVGGAYPLPWEKIKPFPEREPMLGWYPEGEVSVMSKQLEWMSQYGIRYVVFNWFWSRDDKPVLTHALNAFLQAPDKHGVELAIMWANHTSYVFSKPQFEAMFRFWAQRYMFRNDYLKVDGKPVVFIFSADVLNKNAAAIGMKTAELFALADRIFKDAGLTGIKFIGGAGGAQPGFDYSATSGYAGYSAYNFHGAALKRFDGGRQMSHSYAELDEGYRDHWNWFLTKADGLYVMPMTAGWDKRPWGGSSDPAHDKSNSTPAQFEAHLREAKRLMDAYPDKTKHMGVICCWNEFGEGSYIEPTRRDGFTYLEQVKKVFGTP
jgi:hypothetical protein